jgi:replicative DNA helicase
MTSDRLPIHDISAEEAVLGSILVDSQAYYKVTSLKAEDFYREKNLWVYQAVIELAKNGIERDQLTVAHELANKGRLEACGGAAYLSHLVANVATSVNVKYYADIVTRCAAYRRLLSAAAAIENIAYDGGLDFEKSLADVLRLVVGLKKNTRSKVRTPKDRAESAIEMYSGYADGTIRRTAFGIPTLDKMGGMAPGSYNVLCGETKMGKTSIAKQIADFVAVDGPVLYATGEMTEPQWNQRDIARILHQPMKYLANQQFIVDHLDDILRATGTVAEGNIHTITGSVSPEDIYAEACNIEGLKLIVVDYLQILRGVTADYKLTSQASSAIARIAKETEIPVLALSQLSRDNAKNPADRKPWTQRLKDSGNIENDADLVLNISRDQDAKPGSRGYREATLSIGFSRQGGERIAISLEFNYDWQIYLEVSR